MTKTHDEQHALTQQVASRIYQKDNLAKHFDMRLGEVSPGRATLTMYVRHEMLNGLGICHGGVTFALADTAFAYACNSRNHKTVALNCIISYSLAVLEGDELTAIAEEKVLNKSTGTYDVTISNQDGKVVALFRGTSYSTRQPLFPELSQGG